MKIGNKSILVLRALIFIWLYSHRISYTQIKLFYFVYLTDTHIGLDVFQYKSGNFWTAFAAPDLLLRETCRLMFPTFSPRGDAVANIQPSVKNKAVQLDRSYIFVNVETIYPFCIIFWLFSWKVMSSILNLCNIRFCMQVHNTFSAVW